MKILLTGSSGFLGKNIIEQFNKIIPSQNKHLLTPSSSELNLLDDGSIKNYLKNNKPDFIIHAAGIVGGIQANILNPVKFLVENTLMATFLIKGAHDFGVPSLLNIGSSCMYPRDLNNPLEESNLFKGECEPTNEGYAISKLYAQRLCSYINKEQNFKSYKTIIPCNLYGKWDSFLDNKSHMIPAAIKKIHHAKVNGIDNVTIWGSGSARRENMYASDLGEFICFIINNFELIPEVMNVGAGCDYTITEYYNYICGTINYGGNLIYDLEKPEGMKQKLVSVTKQKNIGWEPKTSIIQGLKKTYKFYKENY